MTWLITTLGPFGLLCMGVVIGALVVAFLLHVEKHYQRRQARARRLELRAQRHHHLRNLIEEP